MSDIDMRTMVGDALTLADFGDDAKQMPAAKFSEVHGRGFLLLNAAVASMKPGGVGETVNMESRPGYAGGLPRLDFFVFPVKQGDQDFVSLGRTDTNDIALNDQSISKFHAFFQRDGNSFALTDAGSMNGTFVNEQPVPRRGEGPPVHLDPGTRVRFGNVDVTYLGSQEFWNLVRRLAI